MKTPKREDVDPIDEPVYDCMGGICDITNDWEPVHVAHARWKRKNRIKQLKRTIERLNNDSIANYFHGYNAGLQHGIEIGFLQGSKKLSENILFQKKENQQ